MLAPITALLALAATAIAAPAATPLDIEKRAVTDADILQYALTLEHLENAFYKKALSMWPESQFVASGQTAKFYNQLKYVAHDEESHVVVLTSSLKAAGASPVAACTYKFPMTNPAEFIALASVIEGVGVAAYLGGAPLISSKAYLSAAGSILVTEAIHQSALRNAANEIPMANPYGAALGLNAVYSIASAFITACPSTNAKLPVSAFPGLKLVSGLPTAAGATIDIIPASMPPADCYVTYVSGLSMLSVKPTSMVGGMIMAPVPAGLEGQSYVFITKTANMTGDADILFGPAIVEITPSSPTFDLSIM